jgi:hypothetical protein
MLTRKTPLKRKNYLQKVVTQVYKQTGLKKRAYSKLKARVKTEEQKKQQQEDIAKMWGLFIEIWNKRPHYSEVSGVWLGNEPKSWMFDHLLEKSKYPEIKYEKWNIALVSFDEHSRKTNGFPLPKHQELIELARGIYETQNQ